MAIDLDAGTARDVTAECFALAASLATTLADGPEPRARAPSVEPPPTRIPRPGPYLRPFLACSSIWRRASAAAISRCMNPPWPFLAFTLAWCSASYLLMWLRM